MSDIFNKLNQLKGKLTELEVNIADEVRKEQTMGSYKERLDKKLPLLREMQRERVNINVGNELLVTTSKSTINNFPFKLSIKEEVKSTNNEIFVDSSESLFSGILEIIRSLSNDPDIKEKRKLIVTCNTNALEIHAKEYFGEDTTKILEGFELISIPFWTKCKKEEKKEKTLINGELMLIFYVTAVDLKMMVLIGEKDAAMTEQMIVTVLIFTLLHVLHAIHLIL